MPFTVGSDSSFKKDNIRGPFSWPCVVGLCIAELRYQANDIVSPLAGAIATWQVGSGNRESLMVATPRYQMRVSRPHEHLWALISFNETLRTVASDLRIGQLRSHPRAYDYHTAVAGRLEVDNVSKSHLFPAAEMMLVDLLPPSLHSLLPGLLELRKL